MKNQHIIFVVTMALMLTACGGIIDSSALYNEEYMPVIVAEGDFISIANGRGEIIVNNVWPTSAIVSPISHGVYWVGTKKDGYQLYSVNDPKKPVTDKIFESVLPFKGDVTAAVPFEQPICFINNRGEILSYMSEDCSTVYQPTAELEAVCERSVGDDKIYEIFSVKNGRVLYRTENEFIYSIGEGFWRVHKEDGSTKVITTSGKEILSLPADGEQIHDGFSQGYLTVLKPNNKGLAVYNSKGERLFESPLTVGEVSSDVSRTGVMIDGFMTVNDPNGEKFGVLNSMGEVVIAPKYSLLINMGQGQFIGRREGEKIGVIDSKESTVVDFDYIDASQRTLGNNYLLKNYITRDWILIDRNGNHVKTQDKLWHAVSPNWYDQGAVSFFNLNGVINSVVHAVTTFPPGTPFSTLRTEYYSGTPEELKSCRVFYVNVQNGPVTWVMNTFFDGTLVSERFHDVKENDGWFETTRSVSDGYRYNDSVTAQKVDLTLNLYGVSTSPARVLEKIEAGLKATGFESREDSTGNVDYIKGNTRLSAWVDKGVIKIISTPLSDEDF